MCLANTAYFGLAPLGILTTLVGKERMPPQFTDVPEMSLWSQSIGGLIINFGIAEFLTLQCVEKCCGPQAAIDIKKKKLSERIAAAEAALSASRLSLKEKNRAHELWSEVSVLSQIRNRIAHNPIFMGFSASQNRRVFSIIDLKKMVPVGENALEPLDHSEIAATALRVRDIAQELSSLIEAVPV